jgi:hypothetical protein
MPNLIHRQIFSIFLFQQPGDIFPIVAPVCIRPVDNVVSGGVSGGVYHIGGQGEPDARAGVFVKHILVMFFGSYHNSLSETV